MTDVLVTQQLLLKLFQNAYSSSSAPATRSILRQRLDLVGGLTPLAIIPRRSGRHRAVMRDSIEIATESLSSICFQFIFQYL